jgi:hypothetical protein
MEALPHMYMHFSVGLHSNNLCMLVHCQYDRLHHLKFLWTTNLYTHIFTSMVVDTKSFMCGSGISVGLLTTAIDVAMTTTH